MRVDLRRGVINRDGRPSAGNGEPEVVEQDHGHTAPAEDPRGELVSDHLSGLRARHRRDQGRQQHHRPEHGRGDAGDESDEVADHHLACQALCAVAGGAHLRSTAPIASRAT